MKILILLALIYLVYTNAFSQNLNRFAKLEVNLHNFESDEGNVRVHLYNYETKQYFPANSEKKYKLVVSNIIDKKAIIVFDSIPYGNYAITVHHDRNLNVKMDLNLLGFPKEGWGLSKDVMPTFSLPDFEECQFEVNKEFQKVSIKMRNGLF